jgi:WD40 repeat protein
MMTPADHSFRPLSRKKLPMCGIVIVLTVGAMLTGWASSWTTNAPMHQSRQMHAAALLPNGNVLVTGGNGLPGFQDLASAELFDPVSNSWEVTDSMSTNRVLHTMTLLTNGKVLVAGGYGTSASLTSAELFDPTTKTWAPAGTMANGRAAHTATMLPNGKVLLAGGYNLATAELYDPMTGTWTNTGSMNSARHRHTATLLPNGTVLVAGGSGSSDLSSAEIYVPASGVWTNTGSLNAPRYFHQACFLPLSGKVIVTGGDPQSTVLNDPSVELYDPNTGQWSQTSPLDTALYGQTMTLLPNGLLLLAGGTFPPSFSGCADKYAWLFNPISEQWKPTAPLNGGRYWHRATLLSDGRVLVMGGGGDFDEPSRIASAETYSYIEPIDLKIGAQSGVRIGFKNTRGASFTAFATTNTSLPASNWMVLGTVVENLPGQFEFTDSQAANYAQRFYRVRAN